MKLTVLFTIIGTFVLSALSSYGSPTANEALSLLSEGNARYVAGTSKHPDQEVERRAALAAGQTPFASVLSCSDSRVPVELLFDQGIGDTFVIRVAGNVAATDEIGSIEYGVGHLHTPLLVVMGHTSCGAVKAVVEGAQVHGSIPKLVEHIAPAVAQARKSQLTGSALVMAAVKYNVWTSIDDIFQNSEEVRNLVKAGKLTVVGAVYDLESGKVDWLGSHPEQARLLTSTGGVAHEEASTPEKEAEKPHETEAPPVAAASVEPQPKDQRPWIIGGFIVTAMLGYGLHVFSKNGMNLWPIGRRLTTGFGLMALLLLLVGFIAYEGLHVTAEGFNEYRADAKNSVLTGRIQANFLEMRIAVKDFALTRKSSDITQYNERRAKVLAFIEEARKAISEPTRLQLLDTISSGVKEHYALFQELSKGPSPAVFSEISKRMAEHGERIDHAAETLKMEIIAEQNHDGPLIKNKIHDTQSLTLWISLFTVLLSIQGAYAISRSITAPLQEIADQMGGAATLVASTTDGLAETSQSLAQGSVEQAASLTETSASLEEISAMASRSTENATEGTALGKQARDSATTGLNRIADLGRTLSSIKGAVAEMQAAVSETLASSQEIGKIIKTIDEIAFQTNLLALNAAVEAARAGEAGMGFAVVADEVRSLAQRSAQAAKDTTEKIEIAVKRSEMGGVASTKVVASLAEVEATSILIQQAFNGISEQINSLDTAITAIASASQEQNIGIGQVSEAVNMLDQVTQANAGHAEKNASASEELSDQANELQGMVEQLQLLVTGSAHPHSAAAETQKASLTEKSKGTNSRSRRKTSGETERGAGRGKSRRVADNSGRRKRDDSSFENF